MRQVVTYSRLVSGREGDTVVRYGPAAAPDLALQIPPLEERGERAAQGLPADPEVAHQPGLLERPIGEVVELGVEKHVDGQVPGMELRIGSRGKQCLGNHLGICDIM